MTESTTPFEPQGTPSSPLSFHKYGSFWERFAAILIDIIILAVAGQFISRIFASPSPEEIREIMEGEGLGSALRASYFSTASKMTLLMQWLYFSLMHSSSWQATLGKRALGLKVTGMNGQRITFINATGRYFASYISTIILLIGYLMMLWDDKNQTLHDKLAKTLVVKSK